MADRHIVEVGTLITFEGVENLEEVTKQIDNSLKALSRYFKNGTAVLTFDANALNRLEQFLAGFEEVLTKLTTLMNKSIRIQLEDGDIQKMKTAIEEVFMEVLSKMGDEIGKLARAAGVVSRSTKKGISVASIEKNVDTGEVTVPALGAVEQTRDDLKKQNDLLIRSMGEYRKNFSAQVDRFTSVLGKSVLDPFSGITNVLSKDFEKEIRTIQRQTGKTVGELISYADELENKIRFSGLGKEARAELTAELGVVRELIASFSRVGQEAEEYGKQLLKNAKNAKESDKLDDRLNQRRLQYQSLLKQGELLDLRGGSSGAEIASLADLFGKLGLTITNDIKAYQKFEDELTTSGRALRNSIERTKEEVKALTAEYGVIARGPAQEGDADRLQSIRKEIAALEAKRAVEEENIQVINKQLVAIDKSKKELVEYDVVTRNYLGSLRSFQRGLEETQRLIERVDRNVARASFRFATATKQLSQFVDRLQNNSSLELAVIDVSDYKLAKKSIQDIENEYGNLANRIAEVRVQEELQIQSLRQQFKERSGFFAAYDPNSEANKGIDKAQLEKDAEARLAEALSGVSAKAQKDVDDMQKRVDHLKETLESDTVAAVRKLSTRFEDFQKAEKNVEDLAKKLERLESVADVFKDSTQSLDRSTNSIKEQALLLDKLDKQYKEVQATLIDLNAERSRLAKQGGVDLTNLTNEITQQEEKLKRVGGKIGELRQGGAGPAFSVAVDAAEIKRAEEAYLKFGQGIELFGRKFESNIAIMRKGGPAAGQAATDTKNMGTEARKAANEIDLIVESMLRQERAGLRLSAVEKQNLAQLQALSGRYREYAAQVDRAKTELSDIERSAVRAGRGFQLYNKELADSILQNLKFVNSITIISSAMFAVRSAFTELLEESRAFSRTLTVMRSDTRSLAEVYEVLKTTVRDTAIEFGERIEVVAEVVKQFGSAGFSAEESLSALNSTMQLIVATQASAEEATRNVAGIYRVFGSELKKGRSDMQAFARINDVLTSVYQNHQAELDEMNQGFRFASAAARAAGFSFEDTAAFLAVLNDNMIKSGAAGRGLQVIFAQMSKKSKEFAEALNIKIDPNSPLSDQFLGVLEQVNQQMSTGALTVSQLEKQFKLMGLRGARSFLVLSKQLPDVKKAMNELNNEADGTANKLSLIVRGELAKEFESAKQSLLNLARDGLEPLKDGLIFFSNFISSISEALEKLGVVSEYAAKFVVFGGALMIIFQTTLAVSQVISTLVDRFGVLYLAVNENALIAKKAAVDNAVLAESQNAVGASASKAAAQVSLLNGIQGKGGRIMAAIGGKAGLAGLLITSVLGLVGAYQAFQTSTRELNRELDQFAASLSQAEENSRKLKVFQENLVEIDTALKTTAISSEVAGQKIRDAFTAVGGQLISQKELIGKTNEELREDFKELNKQAQNQISIATAANEAKIRQDRKSFIAGLEDQVGGIINGGALSGTPLDDTLNRNLERLEVARGAYNDAVTKLSEKAAEGDKQQVYFYTKFIRDQAGLVKKLQDQTESQIDTLVTTAEKAERVSALDYFRNFIKQGENGAKILEELDKRIKKVETTTIGFKAASIEAADANEEIWLRLKGILEATNAPFDDKVFNDIVFRLGEIEEQAESSRKSIAGLTKGVGLGKGSIEQQVVGDIEVDIPQDVREEFAQQLLSGLDDSQLKVLSKFISSSYDYTVKELKATDKQALADIIFYGQKDGKIVGTDLINNIEEISQVLGVSDDVAKQLILNLANMTQRGKLNESKNAFKDMASAMLQAKLSTTALNDVIQKSNQVRQLKQMNKGWDLAELSIKNVTKAYQDQFDKVGQLANQIKTKSDGEKKLSDAQLEGVKKELDEEQKVLAVDTQRLDLFVQLVAARKALNVAVKQNQAELQKQLVVSRQVIRGGKSQFTTQVNIVAQREQELKNVKSLQKAQEDLTGSMFGSRKALTELLKLRDTILEDQRTLLEEVVKENSLRFEILGTIAKINDSKNQNADIEFRILDALQKVSYINGELLRFQDNSNISVSERLRLYKELLGAIQFIFDLEEQLKKKEEELNALLDKRLDILRKLRNSFESDLSRIVDATRKTLDQMFADNPVETAVKLAKDLGISVNQVLALPQQALEKWSDLMKQGQIATTSFGGEIQTLVDRARGLSNETNLLRESVTALEEQLLAQQEQNFFEYLEAGKIKDAEKALDKFLALSEAAYKDNPAQYQEHLRKALALNTQLAEAVKKQGDEIKLKLNLFNKDEILELIALLKKRVAEIKLDVTTVTGIKQIAESFREIAAGTKSLTDIGLGQSEDQASDTVGDLKRLQGLQVDIERRLESYSRELVEKADKNLEDNKALIEAVKRLGGSNTTDEKGGNKFAKGGFIPGFGGGDIIPAMLEPGEFVIPKDIVRKLGLPFFEGLRRGLIPGFAAGGAVGGGTTSFGVALPTYVKESVNVQKVQLKTSISLLDAVKKASVTANVDARKTRSELDKLTEPGQGGTTAAEKKYQEGLGKAQYSDEKGAKAAAEAGKAIIEKSGVFKALASLTEDLITNGFKETYEFFKNNFIPTFAQANAQAFAEFKNQLAQVNKQYQEQFTSVETGLKRNKTSYLDYLNAVEDAEKTRIQAIIQAQEAYRNQLQKTADVFRTSIDEATTTLFDAFGKFNAEAASAIADDLFGSIDDNISKIAVGVAKLKPGISNALEDAFYEFELDKIFDSNFARKTVKFFEDLGEEIRNSNFIKSISGGFNEAVAEGLGDVFGGLGSLIGQGGAAALGGLGTAALGAISSIAGITTNANADDMIMFIERFLEELPETAPKFLDKLIENIDRVFEAVAEAAPIVIDTLVTELPKFVEGLISTLQESLPSILKSLADGLPKLIEGLVPLVGQLVQTLVENIPTIIQALARSLPILIAELIKVILSPSFWITIVKAIVESIIGAIKGLFTGILDVLDVFHDGGIVGGRRDEQLIIAQRGEGILSRRGLQALGGPGVLDALNSGNNPFMDFERIKKSGLLDIYHDGGYIGPKVSSGFTPFGSNVSQGSAGFNQQNIINLNYQSTGGESDAELDRRARVMAVAFDDELSKMDADNRSKFSKQLRD